MENDIDGLTQLALQQWGKETQLDIVIEECAELIDAIQKWRRNRVGIERVVEEGVDVEICLAQLKLILNNTVLWKNIREEKLIRLAGLFR